MKSKILSKIIKIVNFSLKVDSNSTSTTLMFQPIPPQALKDYKLNDK